jgi:hypothetical protein
LNYIEKNYNNLKLLGMKKLERVLKDEETDKIGGFFQYIQ